MYAIRENKVCKVEVVKESHRGTAVWCKLEGMTKNKLISYSKIFDTQEDALKVLRETLLIKKEKERKIIRESQEIEKIIFKAMNDFNVEIKYLDRPSSIEEAKNIYNKLKSEQCKETS